MEQHTKPRCGSGRIYGDTSARRVKHMLVSPRVSSSGTPGQINIDCVPVPATHPTESNTDTWSVSRGTAAGQKPQLQPSLSTQHLLTSADHHSLVSGDISAHRMTEDRLTVLEDKTGRILDMLQQLLSTQPAGKDPSAGNSLQERVQAVESKMDRVITLLEQSDGLKNIQTECSCQMNMMCQCHRLQKACSAEDLQDVTDGHLVVDYAAGTAVGVVPSACQQPGDLESGAARETSEPATATTGAAPRTLPSGDWSEPPGPARRAAPQNGDGRTSGPAVSSPPRRVNERHGFRVARRLPELLPSGEKETVQRTARTDAPMSVKFRVYFGEKRTAGKSSRPPRGVTDASWRARPGAVLQQRRGTPGDAPTAADSGATAGSRPLRRKRHLVESPAPAPRIPNTLTGRSDGIKDEPCDGVDVPRTVNGADWQIRRQSPNTNTNPGTTLDAIKRELDIFLADVPPLKREPPRP